MGQGRGLLSVTLLGVDREASVTNYGYSARPPQSGSLAYCGMLSDSCAWRTDIGSLKDGPKENLYQLRLRS